MTPPVCAGQSLLHTKRVLGILVYMHEKGLVAWKGLNIFNNQITFWFRGVCDMWFSVLMWLFLYLRFSLLHCERVSGCVACTCKECQSAWERLTIHRTLSHFNFWNDITSPVYIDLSILHAKRVLGSIDHTPQTVLACKKLGCSYSLNGVIMSPLG